MLSSAEGQIGVMKNRPGIGVELDERIVTKYRLCPFLEITARSSW
jgi:hypothetical protein